MPYEFFQRTNLIHLLQSDVQEIGQTSFAETTM